MVKTAKQLREAFLDFFTQKSHKIIPSASLVPPTEVELVGTQKVLFTTAGMHPLIPYFLGKPHPAGRKLVNVQKCLRTDDIEAVGDAWHNTFFEMLGNWSLGEPTAPGGIGSTGYWKKEAISWSFEFLTKKLGISKNKIWVTVFGGDAQIPGVSEDKESILIWQNLGIDKSRIIKLGKKDNWWGPVGETGPCGPDTEAFIEVTGKPHGPSCYPGDDCGRFAEVWNDVFMEFNKTSQGKFIPLQQKNVDTGMGLERTIAVLQGKSNVFETEIFSPIVGEIKNLGKIPNIKATRIVADHLRSATFLVADGVLPSNIERGYVLRRLIRRAIRYSKRLGIEKTFTAKIAARVIDIYGEIYDELIKASSLIETQLTIEEENFERVIQEGLSKSEKVLAKKIPIEKEKFSKMMVVDKKQEIFREIYRQKKTGKPAVSLSKFNLNLKQEEVDKATITGKEAFDLYQTYGLPVEMIVDLAQARNLLVDIEGFEEELRKHRQLSRSRSQKKFAGGLADYSESVIAGHTATHLLHQALRDVLGNHVYQTGSNITAERIRFDFSHGEKLTSEQIKAVERLVNDKIRQALPVTSQVMSLDKAKGIGAIGLFGEKYGDRVSVYFIGQPENSRQAYSIEFCGGPHVKNTRQLGRFKIIKEESTGARKRRIYAKLAKDN